MNNLLFQRRQKPPSDFIPKNKISLTVWESLNVFYWWNGHTGCCFFFLNTIHNYTFSHLEGNPMIQFQSLFFKTITRKEKEKKIHMKRKKCENDHRLGNSHKSRKFQVKASSWIIPRSSSKDNQSTRQTISLGTSSITSIRPSPAGKKMTPPYTTNRLQIP